MDGTILATTDRSLDNISTVNVNLEKYNQRQVKNSHTAKYFQNKAGLSTRAFLKMIDACAISNYPINREAIKTAQDICGVSVAYLKGKSIRKQGDAVELNVETITPIPPDLMSKNGNIVMAMDIMKVNGVPFITTISWTLKFGSAT